MPWCDPCGKYWQPNEVSTSGACPQCTTVLATKGALRSEARALGLPGPGEEVGEAPKTPWHFKVLLVAAGGYLAWRAVAGVIWLIDRL
jgi:hypothetical protein